MYPKDYDSGECQADVGVCGFMSCNCSRCQESKEAMWRVNPYDAQYGKIGKEFKEQYLGEFIEPKSHYSKVFYQDIIAEGTKAYLIRLARYRDKDVDVWIAKRIIKDLDKEAKSMFVLTGIYVRIIRSKLTDMQNAQYATAPLNNGKFLVEQLLGKEFIVPVKVSVQLCPYCGGTNCDCGRAV